MAYQYPYGDTQQLNLAWFLDEFKALQEAWEQEKQGITGALDAEIARAEAALSGVIEARDQAAASAADALAYRNTAQSASQAAELSKTNAETARRDAANYAVSAAGSAQNASNSAIAAGNSATLAESAKTTAIQQANAAVQASGAASGYAQTAGQEAANAAASATTAAGSATTAGKEADRAEDAADEVADSVTQIATNKSDISDLKESIKLNDFNLLSLDGATGSMYGLDVFDGSFFKGAFNSYDANICITHELTTSPFASLPDEYFTIPLIANKKYTFVVTMIADATNPISAITPCDKTTRTVTQIILATYTSGGIFTFDFTPNRTDDYAIKVYFPKSVNIRFLKLLMLPENNIYQRVNQSTALSLSN